MLRRGVPSFRGDAWGRESIGGRGACIQEGRGCGACGVLRQPSQWALGAQGNDILCPLDEPFMGSGGIVSGPGSDGLDVQYEARLSQRMHAVMLWAGLGSMDAKISADLHDVLKPQTQLIGDWIRDEQSRREFFGPDVSEAALVVHIQR